MTTNTQQKQQKLKRPAREGESGPCGAEPRGCVWSTNSQPTRHGRGPAAHRQDRCRQVGFRQSREWCSTCVKRDNASRLGAHAAPRHISCALPRYVSYLISTQNPLFDVQQAYAALPLLIFWVHVSRTPAPLLVIALNLLYATVSLLAFPAQSCSAKNRHQCASSVHRKFGIVTMQCPSRSTSFGYCILLPGCSCSTNWTCSTRGRGDPRVEDGKGTNIPT